MVALLILLCAAREALAGAPCTIKVDAVHVDQGGNVAVHGTTGPGSFPFTGWQLLCNLKRSDSVGPIVCGNWFEAAIHALGEQPTTIGLQMTFNFGTCGDFVIPTSVLIRR